MHYIWHTGSCTNTSLQVRQIKTTDHSGLKQLSRDLNACEIIPQAFFIYQRRVPPHTLKYSAKKLDWNLCLSDIKTERSTAKLSAVLLVKEPKDILRFKTRCRSR